jgi:hypothetical protein
VNEAGFNTTSFFDAGGNLLRSANEYGQLTAPLNLNISVADMGLVLSWPLSSAGFSLTTTTNLTPPVVWSPLPSTIQNTGTVYWTTLPPDSGPQRFYRLQSNW